MEMSLKRFGEYGTSLVVGALSGAATSFAVNCVLVEISTNSFFAWYFGMVFVIMGVIILWRIGTGEHPQANLLGVFALLVLLSGLVCFVLERNWFIRLSKTNKVPLYCLLGISTCFALIFSVVDLLNYCTGLLCCSKMNCKPLVDGESQVYLVVGTAIVMGFLFGMEFGLFDVEDATSYQMLLRLKREQTICYPIGALIGAASSGINQCLREKNKDKYKFDLLDNNLDDDEYM